jgi:hypothetical protein
MKYIYPDENSIVLKSSLKERRNIRVGDQLPRGADRPIQPAIAANLDAARKKLAGEHPDIVSLLHDRLCGCVRLRGTLRLMHLPIQALEALAACHVSALGQ